MSCYIHCIVCRTPLHWAAATGHAHCVAHLLRLESYKDAEDKHGGTPFQYAQQGHHSACCQLLIDHDPHNPLATEVPVRRGNTFLCCLLVTLVSLRHRISGATPAGATPGAHRITIADLHFTYYCKINSDETKEKMGQDSTCTCSSKIQRY